MFIIGPWSEDCEKAVPAGWTSLLSTMALLAVLPMSVGLGLALREPMASIIAFGGILAIATIFLVRRNRNMAVDLIRGESRTARLA